MNCKLRGKDEQISMLNNENRKQQNNEWPNFDSTVNSVNDGILVQERGELNYNIGVSIGIKTSFNLTYYNSRLDARIKSYNILEFQSQLKRFFFFSTANFYNCIVLFL